MEAKLQIPWNRDSMDGTLIVRVEYGIIDWLVGLWRVEKNLQTLRGKEVYCDGEFVCAEKRSNCYIFLNVRIG